MRSCAPEREESCQRQARLERVIGPSGDVYQLHGGTGGLAGIALFLFVCVPLIVLGSSLLVLNVVGLLRNARMRKRAVTVTLSSSLLVAAGLLAMAWIYYEPAHSWFAACLACGGVLLAWLAAWSFRRNCISVG